jgi:hypothetical protein
MGTFALDIDVDSSGIITAVTGDPRGAHYVGQVYAQFMSRRSRKQLKSGAYRRDEG